MGFAVGKEHLQLATDGDVKIHKEERDVVFPGNTAERREIYVCFDVHVTFLVNDCQEYDQPFREFEIKSSSVYSYYELDLGIAWHLVMYVPPKYHAKGQSIRIAKPWIPAEAKARLCCR